MPTRNRPELLERAIGSVIEAAGPVAQQVEVAVSDGSSDDASGQVVARLLADWPGGYRYVWNRPALDLPGNMNRATSLAVGQWILQLHDDDLLRPGRRPGRARRRRARRARRSGCCCSGSTSSAWTGRSAGPRPSAASATCRPGGDAAGPAQLLLRAPAGGGGAPGGVRGGGRVRGHPRGGLRHRHVDAAVLPLRRALRAPHHLRLHGARGGHHHRHVEPGDRPRRPQDLRSRRRPRGRARAHHPALGDRLLPPVHPRRRLPAPPDAAAGRGPRGASAVRPAGDPRPWRLAEVAAGAGRVRGGHRRDTPSSSDPTPRRRER